MFDKRNASHAELFITPTVDTCFITELYMQRPQKFIAMSLGQWFNYCHELKDNDLVQSASALLTKKLIVSKGYNRLPLEVLGQHNKRAAREFAKHG